METKVKEQCLWDNDDATNLMGHPETRKGLKLLKLSQVIFKL